MSMKSPGYSIVKLFLTSSCDFEFNSRILLAAVLLVHKYEKIIIGIASFLKRVTTYLER